MSMYKVVLMKGREVLLEEFVGVCLRHSLLQACST